MNKEDKILILARITTRDEAGRHFTEIYDAEDLAVLEEEGLIEIVRPVHEPTGIPYSMEFWAVHVTDRGMALVEASEAYAAAVAWGRQHFDGVRVERRRKA
jgi:hypothetical protein